MKYVGGGGGSYGRWQRDFGQVLMHLISHLKWQTSLSFLFSSLLIFILLKNEKFGLKIDHIFAVNNHWRNYKKKGNFLLSIFLVNVTKSTGNCRFGHIY